MRCNINTLTPAFVISALVFASILHGTEFRVLEADRDGLTIAFIAHEPAKSSVTAQGREYDLFTMPDTGLMTGPGLPGLPVRGCLVGIPPGRTPRIELLHASPPVLFPAGKILPAPRLSGSPLTPAPLQREVRADPGIYEADACFPPALFEAGTPFVIRGHRLQGIRFFPLQYSPAGGQVRFFKEIILRVRFPARAGSGGINGRPPGPFDPFLARHVLNYPACLAFGGERAASGRDVTGRRPLGIRNAAKIRVEEDGVYVVTASDLTNAGVEISDINPRYVRLYHRDREIPIYFVGEMDEHFGPLDFFEFYGEAVDDDFTLANIYWLLEDTASPGARIPVRDGTVSGSGTVPDAYTDTIRFEENEVYFQNIDNGEGLEHWFWEQLVGPSQNDYFFDLPYRYVTSDPCSLRVRIQPKTDTADPDEHHVSLYINDTFVCEEIWEDMVPTVMDGQFPQSLLGETDNELTIKLEDNGILNILYSDWYELTYRDRFVAENNELVFSLPAGGPYQVEVSNFSGANVRAYDISDPASPVRIINGSAQLSGGKYTILFDDTPAAEQTYIMLRNNRRKTPAGIQIDEASDLKNGANRADYIIITHARFYPQARDLAAYREAQGYAAAVVKIADIYDEFNGGIKHPEAIKDFLTYAYEQWQAPAPHLVLLLGEANMDYRDYDQSGFRDYIPAHIIETDEIGQTPTDNWYACVDGPDFIPDLFIGRLSVSTAAQARSVVDKIILYEGDEYTHHWDKKLVLAAGNGSVFESACSAVCASLAPNYHCRYVFKNDYNPLSEATQALIDQVDGGRLFTAYIGHGAVTSWSVSPPLFTIDDVTSFQNTGRLTIMLALTCFSGFYPSWVDPVCMSEAWTVEPDKGAAASIASSCVGTVPEDIIFANELFSYLPPSNATLGQVLTWAKIVSYTHYGVSAAYMRTCLLFGDPALRIRRSIPGMKHRLEGGGPGFEGHAR
jgi:hypothetical protein